MSLIKRKIKELDKCIDFTHPPFIHHSSPIHPPLIPHSSTTHPPFIHHHHHSSTVHPPLIHHHHHSFTNIHHSSPIHPSLIPHSSTTTITHSPTSTIHPPFIHHSSTFHPPPYTTHSPPSTTTHHPSPCKPPFIPKHPVLCMHWMQRFLALEQPGGSFVICRTGAVASLKRSPRRGDSSVHTMLFESSPWKRGCGGW